MAKAGALELIRMRNKFYRKNYRRLIVAMLALLVVNIVLSVVLGLVVTNRREPLYFATTTVGDIIPLVPLRRPLVSRKALVAWVEQQATTAFTFDFNNYQQQLGILSEQFTDTGWRNFLRAMNESGIFNTVRAKQLNVSAAPAGPAVITRRGLLRGVYSWAVELPILVSFESASERRIEKMAIRVLVRRVSTTRNRKGLGIDQFISAPMA